MGSISAASSTKYLISQSCFDSDPPLAHFGLKIGSSIRRQRASLSYRDPPAIGAQPGPAELSPKAPTKEPAPQHRFQCQCEDGGTI
ncbi:unnamed protein product [marine sediment metagenome]|uniref:Uncharacterized protein n=1 Tax=marine sediment metagenome TaxID=412755 RepID=X0WZD4_9ZZZZ